MIRTSRGGIWTWHDRRAVARLLGGDLPKSAHALHYLCWQPSNDLGYYEALIRLEMPLPDYGEWVARQALETAEDGQFPAGAAAAWSMPADMPKPAWWDPSSDMPPLTAWSGVGEYGLLVMKWELGVVYAHVVDTGHRAVTSQQFAR